ncbi:MAG: PQQ-binding-like beta-propeller repeat protein [Chloroflexi bacterium]|nr:PQQ-binding-like beta-propeller repeat protein [Chloroflexota bacterium]
MFRGSAQRTGVYEVTAAAEIGELVWEIETGGQVHSSPTLADGALYFGSDDGHIYAAEAETGTAVSANTVWIFARSSAVFMGLNR